MNTIAALLLFVTIQSIPATPLIEQTKTGQSINFDLLLENTGDKPLEITELEATVLGENGALVTQRRLMSNGDSIATLPNRTIAPRGKLVVFNPFADFDRDVELRRIRYDFTFADETTASFVVEPRAYPGKTDLILPLRGRVFVHDGHDFLSHHRRLDITGRMTTALGISENMGRYAYDFVLVDETGRMSGFGAPLVAPGAGVIVAAANDREDSTETKRVELKLDEVLKDLTLIFGNYVMIDHGNGEFSFLAHMKKGSVTVKAGDRVKQGHPIGAIGFSGDAIFPHLHYQVQSDAKTGEGLPSYFRDFRRLTGRSWMKVRRGNVDTGDVVESLR
jgi:hypothetical protein